MRIVVDLQSMQTASRLRGIGRYSLSLVRAMARNAGGHEIWVALNTNFPDAVGKVRGALNGVIPQERIRVFDVPLSLESGRWERAASNMIREAFLDGLEPDIVLVSSLFEGFQDIAVTSIGSIETRHRTAAVVYDLIPLIFAEQYLKDDLQRSFYEEKLHSFKRANALLAISESSRQECIEHLGFPDAKITNISAAIDPDFADSALPAEEENHLLTELGINRSIVLYVPGGFDERKNFDRLIEAFGGLPENLRRKHQLVITSKLHDPERIKLLLAKERFELDEDELVLTGYLSDEALITLYKRAELFVFPSLHEGFGLPILEAMACGAAVIGSDRSSIPEGIGWEPALFDPHSVESIRARMCEALEDRAFRQTLKQHAATQVQSFSWDHCAREALRALERLAQEPPRANRLRVTRDRLIGELARIPEKAPSGKETLRAARSIAFNSGLPGERQLLLDVSSIVTSDGKTGIQRVVRSLLNELLTSHHEGLVIRPVYFDKDRFYYANRFAGRIIDGWAAADDDPVDLFQDDIYLSLDLNLHLPEMFSVHERMRLLGIKVAFIVYDLLLVHRPDWWPEGMAVMFNQWLRHVAGTADQLLCISNAVADEVREWIARNGGFRPGNLPHVTSFRLGADIASSLPSKGMPADAGEVLEQLAARPSFLMVGTIEPRKGYPLALAAFERLWSEGTDVNLVIVGKTGWLVNELVETLERHPERGKRLFWLQGISDEYLEAVYAAVTCLLTASEGEGFGLPLIESAQNSLPIIARDLPVFREVAGDHAYYFNNDRPEGLADDVRDWLELFGNEAHPRSEGIKWHTWSESTISLLESLIQNPA